MTGRHLDRLSLNGRSPDDILALAAGVVLFFSPLVFGFGESGAAGWTAHIAGAVIIALSAKLLIAPADWGKWGYLALGLFALASPWLLGFAGTADALWTHLILGVVVAMAGIRRLLVQSRHVGPDAHSA